MSCCGRSRNSRKISSTTTTGSRRVEITFGADKGRKGSTIRQVRMGVYSVLLDGTSTPKEFYTSHFKYID